MKTQLDDRQRKIVGEQAAQWVCDLREAGPEGQAAFLEWLKQSPVHVTEYLFAATVWREAQGVALKSDVDMEKLMEEALTEQKLGNVVELGSAPSVAPSLSLPRFAGEGKRRGGRVWMAAAASVVLAAGGALLVSRFASDTYSTRTGEQRTVRLEDGSLLSMNTQSRILVRFSKHGRDLRLLDGEVLFTVQKDSARPFRVETDGAVIQVLGTQFNVYRRADGTKLSVLDGSVKVTAGGQSEIQTAGQEARIDRKGRIAKRTVPDVSEAVAWRERRLVFQGERLENVAAEFNRYNPKPIRVEGDVARQRLLSGTFNADDPGSLILFLDKLDDLSVEARDGEITVRAR